ncbi:MAG: NAD(P)H-hydrate epimerase, partial [Thermoanaerobaculia bacterium]
MRILTAESMREVDRAAIEDFGIPSLVLMENAAIGLADAIADVFPNTASAAIFCGPGNNGGDGLALGRHLGVRGYHVELNLATGGRETRGDALVQLNICRNQGLPIREIGPDDSLRMALEAAAGVDLVVDALFGVGLKRPLEGEFAELVEALNCLPRPRV